MSGIDRVIDESADDEAWRLFTYRQFLSSYADEDAIYEEYDEQRKRLRVRSRLDPQHLPPNT